MPCPYYKDGKCTSPVLPMPSSSIVNPSRCESDDKYKTCAYYVEEEKGGENLTEYLTTPSEEELKKLKPYPPIHYMEKPLRSQCAHYKLMNYGGYYIAMCTILGRLLTRHEAMLCSRYAETCPIRKSVYRIEVSSS